MLNCKITETGKLYIRLDTSRFIGYGFLILHVHHSRYNYIA